MNRICLFFFSFLFYSSISFSQEKLDNVWVFGYASSSELPLFKGSIMSFEEGTPTAEILDLNILMDIANTSMCDEEGNLLFYTNGRFVANAEHEIMENGDNLNLDFIFGSTFYLIMDQGVLAIPIPDSPSRYYIFHLGLQLLSPNGILDVGAGPFFYSIVDFTNPAYPLGEVVDKNTVIVDDTLDLGKLAATRHANGRDWWIITSRWDTNNFYRFLVSPTGVQNVGMQEVGDDLYEGKGQSVFSPDGTKYVRASLSTVTEAYIDLYDFDRCTGELSNHQQHFFPVGTNLIGTAISPNSRFLYFNTTTKIFQFDLEAEDIWASEQLVAEYDGYEEQVITSAPDTVYVATTFFLEQLGPDGKIYINASNSVSSLTVINNPDLAGEACEVIQHGFDLPALNRISLPNFPNYRLGALEGSVCDSLEVMSRVEEVEQRGEVKIYPNPNQGEFTLEIFETIQQDFMLTLYNNVGSEVHKQACTSNQTTINVENLPMGVYLYQISGLDAEVENGKILITQ